MQIEPETVYPNNKIHVTGDSCTYTTNIKRNNKGDKYTLSVQIWYTTFDEMAGMDYGEIYGIF